MLCLTSLDIQCRSSVFYVWEDECIELTETWQNNWSCKLIFLITEWSTNIGAMRRLYCSLNCAAFSSWRPQVPGEDQVWTRRERVWVVWCQKQSAGCLIHSGWRSLCSEVLLPRGLVPVHGSEHVFFHSWDQNYSCLRNKLSPGLTVIYNPYIYNLCYIYIIDIFTERK